MWKNLAPDLIRQRLIIEGTTEKIVEPEPMKAYLLELAKVAKMEVLSEPMAYTAHEMGYGGWILPVAIFTAILQIRRCLLLIFTPVSPSLFRKSLILQKSISMPLK